MKDKIALSIPTPCHEGWDDMQSTEDGRFCAVCRKTVVDFTMMNDQEILHWISTSNNSFCVRLAPEQTDRTLVPAGKAGKKRGLVWRFLLAGLLISSKAPAQLKK